MQSSRSAVLWAWPEGTSGRVGERLGDGTVRPRIQRPTARRWWPLGFRVVCAGVRGKLRLPDRA